MKFNIKKLRITPGSTFEARSGQTPPGISTLDMIDEGFYALTGLRLPLSCCATTLPTNGQALTWDATNKKLVFTTLSGGGSSVTGVSLGTTTSTTQQIIVSGATNFTLLSSTTTTAGLMSATQFNQLASLVTSGLNSTNSITGNGTVATPFKLVNDIVAPGNNYYYGTDNNGVKGYQLVKYVQTFTIVTFVTQSFTILASTHLKGVDPQIQIFELVAGNYEVVAVDKISVNPSGDVTISVTSGSEFNGKVIIT